MDGMIAEMLIRCVDDMKDVSRTGKWSIEAQIRAYDLLDAVADISDFQCVLGPAAIFCKEFETLEKTLNDAYDEQDLQSQMEMRLKPLREALAAAEGKAAEMAALHSCAAEAYETRQNKGVIAGYAALRRLRRMAGFRLEYRRLGNYVAKTFDLMNEAQAAFARAQQALFAADMSYKIRSGIYGDVRNRLIVNA